MGLFNRASKTRDDSEPVESSAPLLGEQPPVDDAGRRSVDDHRDYLLSMVEPLAPFGMTLVDAWGRTLCEDIKSYNNLPPVPVSEVDGYALRYEDARSAAPGANPVLALVEALESPPAGDAEPAANAELPAGLGANGWAMRVRAGDPMPQNADTVVATEQVSVADDARAITVLTKIALGDWVREPAAEARDGSVLMTAGTVLDDRRSALLAAAGFDRVMARPSTRVALVQFVDSKSERSFDGGRAAGVGVHLINGAVRADGATVWRFDLDLADPKTAAERLSDELIRADLVLTIGGLTDDEVDTRLVDLLGGMGVVDVATVALRPGGRHGFGLIGDEHMPVVMLPSEPAALLVAYHAFARPVLRKMMGTEPFVHDAILCFADHDFDGEAGVTQLVPCRLHQDGNRYVASEMQSRRHNCLSTLASADALVVMPPNRRRVYDGEALACWLLGDQLVVSG